MARSWTDRTREWLLSTPASPLTGSDRTVLVERVPVSRLIRFYDIQVGVDVARFFRGIEEIRVYRCPDTRYEFYWPPSTAGDEAFYSELATREWYYDSDRWEHRVAAEWLSDWCVGGERVLDVGCGSGAFLERVRSGMPDVDVQGIDTSGEAVAQGRAKGLAVRQATAGELAVGPDGTGGGEGGSREPERYDMVAAFQVLEHLADPRSFIESLVALTKPGGRVVIGVPNNAGFLELTRTIPSYCLNMPPHHMGRWTAESLGNLQSLFRLDLVRVEKEPMDVESLERAAFGRVSNLLGGGRVAGLAWRAGAHNLYAKLHRKRLLSMDGHTILAEFRLAQRGG